MSRVILFFLLLSVASPIRAAEKDEPKANKKAEKAEEKVVPTKEPAPPAEVTKNEAGNTQVKVRDDVVQKLQLQLISLTATQMQPQVTAYGKVLDAAPLATLASELLSTRSALQLSQTDLDRVKKLAEQNNIATRAVQTAEATYQRDLILYQTTQNKARITWGNLFKNENEIMSKASALLSGSNLLYRVDLPPGQELEKLPQTAVVKALLNPKKQIATEVLGVVPSVDPQFQGQGFYLLSVGSDFFHPNESIKAFLPTGEEQLSGVVIPEGAIVRSDGNTWIYKEVEKNEFEKIPVHLQWPAKDGYFLVQPLKGGDKIVLVGAETLLAQEVLGQSAPAD